MMQISSEEHGQGLVEYAFLIMLIALVVIILVALFGEAVREMYVDIVSQI